MENRDEQMNKNENTNHRWWKKEKQMSNDKQMEKNKWKTHRDEEKWTPTQKW